MVLFWLFEAPFWCCICSICIIYTWNRLFWRFLQPALSCPPFLTLFLSLFSLFCRLRLALGLPLPETSPKCFWMENWGPMHNSGRTGLAALGKVLTSCLPNMSMRNTSNLIWTTSWSCVLPLHLRLLTQGACCGDYGAHPFLPLALPVLPWVKSPSQWKSLESIYKSTGRIQ